MNFFSAVISFFTLLVCLCTVSVSGQNSITFSRYYGENAACTATELKNTTSLVEAVCSYDANEGLYVKAYCLSASGGLRYQSYMYTDAACTSLVMASAGSANQCVGGNLQVTCSAATTGSVPPSFPTAADGFHLKQSCIAANTNTCTGSSCKTEAFLAGTCIPFNTTAPFLTLFGAIYNCDGANNQLIYAGYADNSCTSANIQTYVTESLGCNSSYPKFISRSFTCATTSGNAIINRLNGTFTRVKQFAGTTCSG